jgi:DNA-binding MarR family transcriptional regulator
LTIILFSCIIVEELSKMKEKPLYGPLDQQLVDTEFIKVHSWGKIVTYLKRQFDFWTTEQLILHGYKNFKIAYMPVLMNVSVDGTNNNELAKRARVSKQAMSKVLKELSLHGYIKTKTDQTDKRSSIVMLTDKGKRFVIDARLCVKDLMDEYRKEIGKADFDETIQTLLKIIEFNDRKISGMHLL